MNRRNFIKRGALLVPAAMAVPTIFIPRLIRAQSITEAGGLAAFTPAPASGGGGGGSTSYANTGGTGDRSAFIFVAATGLAPSMIGGGGESAWVDSNFSNGQGFFSDGSVDSSSSLRFDFGSAVLIDEAKYYQQNTTAQGTWKWQGSNDASSWTGIGSSFALGGVATQTITALAGNTTSYRYYRILGVSGTSSSNPWVYEMEFKIFGL
jgi:hypothetical protein